MSSIASRKAKSLARQAAQLVASQPVNKTSLMRVAGPRARIVQFWRPGRRWWVKVDGYDGAIKVVESESGMLTTFGKHPSRATWPALQVVKAYRKAGYPQIPSHGEWPLP